jgi:hypothetical protein
VSFVGSLGHVPFGDEVHSEKNADSKWNHKAGHAYKGGLLVVLSEQFDINLKTNDEHEENESQIGNFVENWKRTWGENRFAEMWNVAHSSRT